MLAAGTWLLTVVVVLLLAISALAFGAVAVMAPALGVLRTLGIDWVQMEVFSWKVTVLWSVPAALVISVVCGAFAGREVPQEWSLPVAAVVGVALGAGAWLVWGGLRAYVRWPRGGMSGTSGAVRERLSRRRSSWLAPRRYWPVGVRGGLGDGRASGV